MAAPAPRRGPEPPEQEKGPRAGGEDDRDARDRRGADRELGVRELEEATGGDELQLEGGIARRSSSHADDETGGAVLDHDGEIGR